MPASENFDAEADLALSAGATDAVDSGGLDPSSDRSGIVGDVTSEAVRLGSREGGGGTAERPYVATPTLTPALPLPMPPPLPLPSSSSRITASMMSGDIGTPAITVDGAEVRRLRGWRDPTLAARDADE
jgi:hypothetical protein